MQRAGTPNRPEGPRYRDATNASRNEDGPVAHHPIPPRAGPSRPFPGPSVAPGLLRYWRRRQSPRASSDNVTHGTWILVAGAIGTFVIGSVAIPGSPVHRWLHALTQSITCIGPQGTTCPATGPGLSTTASLSTIAQVATLWTLSATASAASNTPSVPWTLSATASAAPNTPSVPWTLTVSP